MGHRSAQRTLAHVDIRRVMATRLVTSLSDLDRDVDCVSLAESSSGSSLSPPLRATAWKVKGGEMLLSLVVTIKAGW